MTDIDLIIEKNGLLLLIQLKTLTGLRNAFEYWKARSDVIRKAVGQAKDSEKYFVLKSKKVLELLKKASISPETIKIIQPIIILPTFTFTGWKIRDIPILGLGYFLSILNGAKIEIFEEGNSKPLLKNFYLSKNPDAEEIHKNITTPYTWNFEKYNAIKKDRIIHVCNINFSVPEIHFNNEFDI